MLEEYLEKFIPEAILNTEYFGNSVERYIVALIVFLVITVLARIFKEIILVKLKDLIHKTSFHFDDELVAAFDKIPGFFYGLLGLYFGLHSLDISDSLGHFLNASLLALIIFQIILSCQGILRYFVKKVFHITEFEQDVTALNGIMLLLNIVIWSVAILMVISNYGVNVASLIASLGIGGIAVALAAQNILGDMFSSFSIYFDKPFVVGDFIVVGDKAGNVANIGLKTTRLESLSGEQIVLSNQELTKSTIHNFKKMPKRRVVFKIGVEYSTSLDKLKEGCQIIKDAINEYSEFVTIDRVNFFEFADSSLNYEIVYYHGNGDYGDYMKYRELICLKIKEEFTKAGLSMAFPTRTLFIEKGE